MRQHDDFTRYVRAPKESTNTSSHQLIVVGPEDSGRTLDLPEGQHVLGRAVDADIRFSLETISRKHAVFVVSGEQVTLEDLGSRTGTFVNGQRIASCILPPGARIVIGGITMKLIKG